MKSNFRVEIKQLSETGEFEGLLSVYNVVDGGGDLVEPGAFTKTMQEHGAEVPLLWQHKPDVPIGKLQLIDGPDALHVKGSLLMELPEAQKAYLLMKANIVKGLSIGYETIKKTMDGTVRRLKELRLFEGSVVTFPMNELALITSVKQAGEVSDFNEELSELQLNAAFWQMGQALGEALCEVRDSDLADADKVATSEAVIQQFSDAYMAYLPAYLAMVAEESTEMEVMGRKYGRRLSAATQTTLKSCHEQMKACHTQMKGAVEILQALLDAEAAEGTSEAEAASKPEPEQKDHSAAQTLIEQIRSLIPAA